jgi:hypothetical protein
VEREPAVSGLPSVARVLAAAGSGDAPTEVEAEPIAEMGDDDADDLDAEEDFYADALEDV